MLESEPGTKELIYTNVKCCLGTQAITIAHSLQKLLYRVFFAFWYECRCELLRIVSELPLMLTVNIYIKCKNTQVNSIYSCQTKVKRKQNAY